MANRNFANGGKVFSMSAAPVMVASNILIGAAGAVSSITGSSMISSVQHLSTGVYKINLKDSFFSMLSAHGSAHSPAVGLSGIMAVEIQNAASASVSASVASLTIKTLDAAGALADPASGSIIDILAIMNNSSVVS